MPRLNSLSQFVRDQIDNLRSNLSKAALILVTELFKAKRDREIAPFVSLTLPSILIKTVYEKNFIV